jgi:NADH-quinone oxidoreductase subunit H
MSNLTFDIIAALVKMVVLIGVIMLAVPMLVWLERKVVADFQARIGPNRVGPFGLLQSFADGIKLFFKEDITPTNVDRWMYLLAPIVVMIPALTVCAVIPFGSTLKMGGYETRLQLTDVPVGVLYLLALSSLGVYGIVLSGWSSNNKYSLLGGLRSSAQMVSYELPMGLAVVAAIMISSSRNANGAGLSLNYIVDAQKGGFWNWNCFWWLVPGMLAFIIYSLCGIAETNRAPFDLPEAETELVAGYHTEYSSMKFAMFFLAEYANMLNVSAIATTLFLGGWRAPIPLGLVEEGSILAALCSVFWFATKILIFIVVFMWLRATLPRLRYDQLMRFAWKGLVPVALANIMLIATLLTLFYSNTPATTTAQRQPAMTAKGQSLTAEAQRTQRGHREGPF